MTAPVKRFQRTLLGTIVGMSLVLGIALLVFAGRFADEVFAFALNDRIQSAVDQPVHAYRALFRARRELDDTRADLAAVRLGDGLDAAGREAVFDTLCQTGEVVSVRVTGEGDARWERLCDQGDIGEAREQTVERPLEGGGTLAITFGMSTRWYDAFRQAGKTSTVYAELSGQALVIKEAYRRAFAVALLLWALVLGGVIWGLARRATRRIGRVVEATTRFAEGETRVEVPIEGEDEIAELARAFNMMVSEVQQREDRIVYLEKISSWQEIARRLAHEIKNPLTPIQLAMQQLQSGYPGDDPRFQKLLDEVGEIVREEVDTLRRLVTEFSDFARMPDVVPEPADLSSWVTDLVRRQPELTDATAITVDTPDGAVPVALDPVMLRRVLVNLVMNAAQAAEAEGLVPKVHLIVTLGERWAVLAVEDEGPGIPDDQRERIFDPYFTTKETGTGLGLPISKKIVLQHRGQLTVAPREGGGSRFEIRLPLTGHPTVPEMNRDN